MSGPGDKPEKLSDEAKAIRLLVIKALVFVLIPLVAAGLAAYFTLPK